MKLPSLVRLPSHRRFHYEPRFYDPQKEEIETRREHIRKELNQEENPISASEYAQTSRIRGHFKHKRSVRSEGNKDTMMRAIFLVITVLGLFLYIKLDGYENYVLGTLAVAFVAYLAYIIKQKM